MAKKKAAESPTASGSVVELKELPPSVLAPIYANHLFIRSTPSDFELRFGVIEVQKGQPLPSDVSRLYLAPIHAKAIAHLLTSHVSLWERKHGTIPLDFSDDSTEP